VGRGPTNVKGGKRELKWDFLFAKDKSGNVVSINKTIRTDEAPDEALLIVSILNREYENLCMYQPSSSILLRE